MAKSGVGAAAGVDSESKPSSSSLQAHREGTQTHKQAGRRAHQEL